MTSVLTCGVVAAAATCASAPFVRAALLRGGVMDVPNDRSSHTIAVVRGGGLACIAGALLTGVAVSEGLPVRPAVAVAGLAVIGFIDDSTGGVPALPRLALQSAMGALVGSSYSASMAVIGVLVMPTVVNIVNFMDGVNGITALSCIVWGVSASIGPSSADVGMLGALIGGMGAGFLPWNAPAPLMFLGDAGSYFLGALMAYGILHAGRNRNSRAALVTAAPLVPYLADAAQAILRRARNGESLTQAHREHVYQQMVDRHGFTHLRAAGLHAVAAGLCAGAARFRSAKLAALACTAVACGYVLMPAVLQGRAS